MKFAQVTINKQTAAQMIKEGWQFDWSLSSSSVSLKAAYQEDDTVQGLIEYERVPRSLFDFVYLIETAPWNNGKDKLLQDVAGTLFAFVANDSLGEAQFTGRRLRGVCCF